MRQICNLAYATITEWKDAKEKDAFDRELSADDPQTVSHGTGALLSLMGGPRFPKGDG